MAQTGGVETGRRVVYTVPTPVALRGVGVGTVGLGACIIGTSALLAVDPSRPVTVAVGLLLALATALALLVLVVGLLRLVRRGARVVLDRDGLLNATGPGTGMRRVAWQDIRRVQTDGPSVLVDVVGGRRSVIRTASLEIGPKDLARELRARITESRGSRKQGA